MGKYKIIQIGSKRSIIRFLFTTTDSIKYEIVDNDFLDMLISDGLVIQ